MNLLRTFIEKAQRNPKRIVYPEGNDTRIIAAASRAAELGIAVPVILGEPREIKAVAAEKGLNLGNVSIINPTGENYVEKYAEAYAESRDLRIAIARRVVRKPLSFGGMMVKMGDADGMVAGVDNATTIVLQTVSLTVGFQEDQSAPSSFFIMVVPEVEGKQDKIFLFADCAVNIAPTAKQLAEIGVATGTNARRLLGIHPKIAFLSFSTKGSAVHENIDRITEAVAEAKKMNPKYEIDGELQADAAIVSRVARKKAGDSIVAGQANVLVFPDLNAGNIAYKLVQHLAHATALGPILQGFAKPVNDMSRGASVEDLIGVTAITSVQAGD